MPTGPTAAPAPGARTDAPWAWRQVALAVGVGVVQVGLTASAASHQDAFRSLDALGVALLAGAAAALPWRQRHPTGVVAVAMAATLAYWSLGFPRGPVFLAMVVAFVHAILAGRRRAAITAAVAGFALFPWLAPILGTDDWPSLASVLALAAWLTALFSVSELVRGRQERAREGRRLQEEAERRRSADERLRIARDVHDVVAHHMSLINVQAGVALHLLDAGGGTPGPATRDALSTIKQASKDALVDLRSILGVLRQPDGDDPRTPTPGLGRLDELVAGATAAGVDVEVDVAPDVEPDALGLPVGLAAYRIIQESLTNVARHSDPPRAWVRVRTDDGALVVEVVDEGRARPRIEVPSGGNGIVGMRERAAAVGGTLEAGPRAGRGFAVRARLPLGSPP